MSKQRKPKYYPNNWKQYKDQPEEFFCGMDGEPISFDKFMEWKINGWLLPSSVSCIIREECSETGKISERVYSNESAARRRLEKQMGQPDNTYIFTICDEATVHTLMPQTLLEENEHLHDQWEGDYECDA